MYKAEIKMKLPSFNEYMNLCRENRFKAAKYKRELQAEIGLFIRKIPAIHSPVRIYFEWYEENGRRDIDNVAFAKKFILDALVNEGKLKDDGAKYVVGFQDSFFYGSEAKVIIYIVEVKK